MGHSQCLKISFKFRSRLQNMADFLIMVCSESYELVTKNKHLHDCPVVMVVVAGLITGNVQPTPTYIMVKYTYYY